MSVAIGVIGAGTMGADHIRTITSAVSGAHVTAVADADPGRAQQAVSGVDGARIVPDPFALINDRAVDAVLVASNDETHEQFVGACLDAGKPVLCEKPLALHPQACLNLVNYERGRRLIQVGFMRRFDPSYLEMKGLLASGAIGGALIVHCAHRNVEAPNYFTGDLPILASAVHEFDILRWLLDQEIVAVTVYTPRRSGFARPDLADPRLIVAQLATGTVAEIEIFVNARYGYEVRCEVVGESGTVALRQPAAVTTTLDRLAATVVPDDFRTRFAQAYRAELQAWVDGIVRGEPTGANAWDGYAAAAVAEACLTSARTGAPARVQLA